MSLATEIDRVLRHSVLARAQPFIRARMPWFHRALLDVRDVVLPFTSRYGLSRYQHRALERFSALSPSLSGPLLEIGSDENAAVLKELSARGFQNVTGINISVNAGSRLRRKAKATPRYEILQADARRLPFKDGSIASILSIAAFEHVHDMDVALREMHRVLKPHGIVYSDFGPIWSCSIGHHVYAIVDGVEARHFKPGRNPVPHFAHLLMSPDELRAAVLKTPWVFPKLADAIVDWICVGRGVNRIFYEDYVRLFESSGFKIRQLNPVREHVPTHLQGLLEQSCTGYREFSVRAIEIVLEKKTY